MTENNLIENTELTSLPNIGKEMDRQLRAVGINTPAELAASGSREAWLRIRAIDASACYNRLCGLEGAIQGIRWHYLDDSLKKELKDFYEANR
ncbi:competence protein TfoX [Acetobacterium paludosum]|uniref:Competence protein TfoX n=1 Tax=Acetobacterium paludosum TaxID=52693 RepID=A0A923HVN3_9FIRM|nr:TfoX/Sxy family protein [Acetobacterium paludosum]MBC3887424.1 competence protein TfoX [Acetobacterium paludosum]